MKRNLHKGGKELSTRTMVSDDHDPADERQEAISTRAQSYRSFIGYLRYVREFWTLHLKCKSFRKYSEHNRDLGNLPYSVWCYDLARFLIDHNTVRLVSAEFGGHVRDCGCDRWEGLRSKRKRR